MSREQIKENMKFQFTFQRGLSKLKKKKKMYEQDLMFSIGYRI